MSAPYGNQIKLFGDDNLQRFLEQRTKEMIKEIDNLEKDDLLSMTTDYWCDYFENKYRMDPVEIDKLGTTVSEEEVDIDVSKDFTRDISDISDRSEPSSIKGTAINFHLPFSGDKELLTWRPSRFYWSSVRAQIDGNDIILTYETTDHNPEKVKKAFEADLKIIKDLIEWSRKDIELFNDSLRKKIKDKVEARKTKLLADQKMVESLGFPLKKREDASQNMFIPVRRRKRISPSFPKASKPFEPEPALKEDDYEDILITISKMALTIEKSPSTYKNMKEEDLRQILLVGLNAHYEWQATGETFNSYGKTDILISVQGRNIFIAECKFWRGAKSFISALDQLFSYATWRNSKLALILFNRNKNLSSVLEQIPNLCRNHPNFRREHKRESETQFRYIFHHNDDENKEMTVTVMVFDVPK